MFLDFLLLALKLHHTMLPTTAIQGSNKQQASGYHHTYLKSHSIDLSLLQSFPSDVEIQIHINTAFQEAHWLWRDLGFIMCTTQRPSNQLLPPIITFASRQPTAADEIFKVLHGPCVQSKPAVDSDGEEEDLANNSEYGQLISTLEHHDRHAHTGESRDVLDGVACASLSLDIACLAEM